MLLLVFPNKVGSVERELFLNIKIPSFMLDVDE